MKRKKKCEIFDGEERKEKFPSSRIMAVHDADVF